MKTAKEEAQELIAKFSPHTDIKNNVGRIDHDLWDKRNKQCALIDIQNTIDATRITAFAAGKDKAWFDKQSKHLFRIKEEITKP